MERRELIKALLALRFSSALFLRQKHEVYGVKAPDLTEEALLSMIEDFSFCDEIFVVESEPR